MLKPRSIIVALSLIALFLGTLSVRRDVAVSNAQILERNTNKEPTQNDDSVAASEIQVALSSAHSTKSWDERDPNRIRFDLPMLFLNRAREASPVVEHSLSISIAGLASTSDIRLEAISFHADVSTGDQHRESKSFAAPSRSCSEKDPCVFQWVFDAASLPSDFYTLRLKDSAGNTLWQSPQPERPDFVALDTWDVELGDYAVRVYYATLFPFARSTKNHDDRLPPIAVADFIADRFVPIIVATWQTQVEQWGFGPLIPDWDADRVVEVIITAFPFALMEGTGTYTVSIDGDGHFYPERRIWWRADSGNFLTYDTLEDGYKVIFAHEFFHLMQANTLLATKRPANRWHSMFIEAQAAFAASLQHPDLELGNARRTSRQSTYTRASNRYLTRLLNVSYADLLNDPDHVYDFALYWRFLYEQYQDMGVLRAALEELALGLEANIVGGMGSVMDKAFARVDGPFQSFEESLTAFARANYALRLDDGRCADKGLSHCRGLYFDPVGLYLAPKLHSERRISGDELQINGAVPTSYGMDFIELSLDPTLQDQPLNLRFQSEGEIARFSVQIWRLTGKDARGPKPATAAPQPVEILPTVNGAQVYAIGNVDLDRFDTLALIITRLDADETADPLGNYQVTLDSAGQVEDNEETN